MRALFLTLSFVATASAPAATESAPPTADPEVEDVFPLSFESDYGSTYNSNCYCLACSRYCTVEGVTYKAGTCC